MTTIDFANLDFAALRASVDLEARADLLAATGSFGQAAAMMKEANRLRKVQFGPWNPNELRDFTNLALAQRIEAGTDETPQEVRPEGREPGPQSGCAQEEQP